MAAPYDDDEDDDETMEFSDGPSREKRRQERLEREREARLAGAVRGESVRQPRNRSYAWMGVLVLLILAGILALAALGYTGPGLFPPNPNPVWLVGACVAALALGLLYVLFTLRSAMRGIREQAIVLARLQSRPFARPARRPAPAMAATDATALPAEDETSWDVPQAEPQPVASSVMAVPTATAMPRYSRPVTTLEGIGPTYSQRLAEAGVSTLDDLRRADEGAIEEAAQARTPVARQWKAMAELMILDGVSAQGAELLVRAGCETIEDLRSRDPAALHRRLIQVNRSHSNRVYPEVLHLADVERWVRAARRNERRDLGYGTSAASAAPAM